MTTTSVTPSSTACLSEVACSNSTAHQCAASTSTQQISKTILSYNNRQKFPENTGSLFRNPHEELAKMPPLVVERLKVLFAA